MTAYFISDIHLDNNLSDNHRLFIKFIDQVAPKAEALYILGDLFEAWFGDDIANQYQMAIMQKLNSLANLIPVYIMRGNRDFLLGKKFANLTNCRLLPDPSIIQIYGQKILLTHGDLLCTNDKYYQKFRFLVQNIITKSIFLLLPKKLRLKIGNTIRKNSITNTKIKYNNNPKLCDININTVIKWFQKSKVNFMIHGHTHKPEVRNIAINNIQHTKITLGDWHQQAQISKLTSNLDEITSSQLQVDTQHADSNSYTNHQLVLFKFS